MPTSQPNGNFTQRTSVPNVAVSAFSCEAYLSMHSREGCGGHLLASCFVLGHMAGHVPDGCGRILHMCIRQLVVVRRKEPPAMHVTEGVSTCPWQHAATCA